MKTLLALSLLLAASGCTTEKFRLRLMSEEALPDFAPDPSVHYEGPLAHYYNDVSYPQMFAIFDEEPGRIIAMSEVSLSKSTFYQPPIFANTRYELEGIPIREVHAKSSPSPRTK
ncbi:MAG: hypothetical protein ACXWP5_12625 [Bdellovibrionota bacterium]